MNVLLVDDHAIVRRGLRCVLTEVYPDLRWGDAGAGADALDALRKEKWDLVVLDLSLPGRDGLDVLKTIHKGWPEIPILVFTMFAEEQYAVRCLRAGASGYLSKSSEIHELVDAVRKLLAGGRYVSPALAQHLATRVVSQLGRPLHESLSDRELQVLRMLASGMTVKEIGYELKLSDKTVSTYRSRLLEKMDMRTASELMRYAIRMDLVE